MKLGLVISVEDTEFGAVAQQGSWEQGVRLARDLGYDGVELAVRDPAAVDAARVADTLAAAGLETAAVGTGQAYLADGLSLSSSDEGIRARAIERVGNHLQFAARLRAPVIIGLLRGRIERGKGETDRRFIDSLRQILPAADRTGTRLLIEPINRYETDYLITLGEALDVIGRVGSPGLGVLADTFHMNIEEVSLVDALRGSGTRLAHVHAADSNRRAPGWGHLNFREIVGVLKEIGYDGYLSAEILPIPDPESAARQAISHLRAIVDGSFESRVTSHESR
ncbi:MAG TPA: 5-keto-L-gluconate epimerase [bacterium]|nr:5-keto-L-gluconate epimerase [bacterium]